jgi:hypothetical protein
MPKALPFVLRTCRSEGDHFSSGVRIGWGRLPSRSLSEAERVFTLSVPPRHLSVNPLRRGGDAASSTESPLYI